MALVHEIGVGFHAKTDSGSQAQARTLQRRQGRLDNLFRVGRKNSLHIGSPRAGPKVAAIVSVVESCRRMKIPVRHYLADGLPGLADTSIRKLPELPPHSVAARNR